VPALRYYRHGRREDRRNAVDLTALIAESLVDLILRVPEDEQAQLKAHTLAALGDLFFQKTGVDGGGSGTSH